ncbi:MULTISPECIES: GNAT family N-acetyltransferase [Streptomyces]|uniref:GNAT family N-acetyltransferase n=1 Tax=Streptomyces lycii TaxID=2654337 RepID=A0ABQ7FE24_9ACTN|nr:MULTISPECIES: GNAT family N-acetyltransferase [Streptomyces]KAF4405919.1 GNAT family N-acetyltransferase [Streptomyces lycii]PGH49207.1 GNAT family N-acetyltransferase [Streptomyces sp. Ru87]
MDYKIGTARPEDWARLRELRLDALRDPVARVAFIETYEDGLERSEESWRRRATPITEGGASTTVFAADADGSWVAMLALLDETADGTVPPQLHIVGVYTRPEYRGTGLAEELFRTAVNWAWDNTGAERVRLWVHGDNPRARAFYARLGFTPTGQTMAFPPRPDETEYELAMERPQS